MTRVFHALLCITTYHKFIFIFKLFHFYVEKLTCLQHDTCRYIPTPRVIVIIYDSILNRY